MRNFKQTGAGILAGLASLVVASAALAQDPNAGGGAAASTNGNTNVGMTLPGTGPTTAAATVGSSDHDTVVGRLAVGYLGRRSMLVGAATDPMTAGSTEVSAPVVGIRYWLDESLGIDAGLGLLIDGGSTEIDDGTTTTDFDDPSFTVFILHGGVPLSLAAADHFSFQIVPEINVGIGSGTDGDGDITHNGFLLDLGARAGAEIQFGFMGIPQLSLQGSIGASFALQSTKTEFDQGAVTSSISSNHTTFGTSVGDNPWNIFTSNVAALYYF